MRQEVMLGGFGGQGIILMGVLLSQAAGYFANKEVAQTQSYGPEARGGACRAGVVISDEQIDYIKLLNPNVFIAMSQPALEKYINEINPETTQVFVDETLVTKIPDSLKHVYRVPATKLAEEECGNRMVANMIMLTALVKTTNLLPVDALKATITNHLPAKLHEVNLKAVDLVSDSLITKN